MIDFFKVNKILMMNNNDGRPPSYNSTVGEETQNRSNDTLVLYSGSIVEPTNAKFDNTNTQLTGGRKFIQDIQNQRGSLKHTKTKAALIGALATSGVVIGGAGAAYYFSDDIIKFFKQYGKQIIKEVPIPEELLPGNNDKLPNALLDSWHNKLPPELQTQIGVDGLLSPDTILPDGTRLGNYVSPEMTEMMMSDPALSKFVNTGRLPATEIPDITIDPDIIDPEALKKVEEFKGINLEFLKDPAVMGGIAGGAALAAILAVIGLALIKVREIKAGEKLVEDAKNLNELVNGRAGAAADVNSKEVTSKGNDGMSEHLKGALNNAIGALPQNEKLNKGLNKLIDSSVNADKDKKLRKLTQNATERLKELIEFRDRHFGQVGGKGFTTKTIARRAFDSVLTMIDEEIEKTAGIIADTLSPELKGSKIDKKTGQSKEGNVVKVDELGLQRHNKFMEAVNKEQNLREEYGGLFPPSRSVEQIKKEQMSMRNPSMSSGGGGVNSKS